MKNTAKTLIGIVAISLSVVVFILLFTWPGYLYLRDFPARFIDEKSIQNNLQTDYKDIVRLKNYFMEFETDVYVSKGNMIKGKMNAEENGMDIPDDDIKQILRGLRSKGYQYIEKNGDCFVVERGNVSDTGKGMVYSENYHEIDIQYLTKLEPLDEENWYYYEADYNEWRTQNQNDA